jgi:carbonic anhydrase
MKKGITSYYLLAWLVLGGVSCTTSSPTTATMTKAAQAATTPAQALQKLVDGNNRFVNGRMAHRDLRKQAIETTTGQYPFASVVSCLDARASTELIFDQGIGDVFSARIAGNIVNPDIIGSLEFASKLAGAKLIAVVGHTECGAVKGACDHAKLGNLTGLLDRIQPAVKDTPSIGGADRSSKNSDFVNRAAENNVRHAMAGIREQSPILKKMEQQGEIKIVGAMHDIATGKVTFLK